MLGYNYFGSESLQKVLVRLKQIVSGEMKPLSPAYGICYQLKWEDNVSSEIYVSRAYCIVKHFAMGWEHHSGQVDYPVEGKYRSYDNLWTGEAGELRMDLCKYLIDQIEIELVEAGG